MRSAGRVSTYTMSISVHSPGHDWLDRSRPEMFSSRINTVTDSNYLTSLRWHCTTNWSLSRGHTQVLLRQRQQRAYSQVPWRFGVIWKVCLWLEELLCWGLTDASHWPALTAANCSNDVINHPSHLTPLNTLAWGGATAELQSWQDYILYHGMSSETSFADRALI